MNFVEKFYLSAPGVATAQGCSRETLAARFFGGELLPLSESGGVPAGLVRDALPAVADTRFSARVNRLSALCLEQISEFVAFAKSIFPAERIGVVLGNSNTGIAEMEDEVRQRVARESEAPLPSRLLELGVPAEFVREFLAISGPTYAVSTACSSAGKAFSSAKNLIANEICDAVIVGGADSFSPFIQSGFASLGLISAKTSAPLSRERDGINVGEGAAFFVMSKIPFPQCEKIGLLGVGESSDAYHLTSPAPDGKGAASSMRNALSDAKISPEQIDYINLHGTGTPANDAMESRAIAEIFGEKIPPCSSSKPFFGHALGASGALEAAVCWLALSQKYNPEKILPPHPEIATVDPACVKIPRVGKNRRSERLDICLSNSFAFGGSNASVIFGKL